MSPSWRLKPAVNFHEIIAVEGEGRRGRKPEGCASKKEPGGSNVHHPKVSSSGPLGLLNCFRVKLYAVPRKGPLRTRV